MVSAAAAARWAMASRRSPCSAKVAPFSAACALTRDHQAHNLRDLHALYEVPWGSSGCTPALAVCCMLRLSVFQA